MLIYMLVFGILFKLYDRDANILLSFTVYPFFIPVFAVMRLAANSV